MKIFGRDILYFDEVTSTFDKLSEYPFQNGLTVVANRQTDGVGRNGRQWLSGDGGLYFSFCILPNCDLEHIPFIAIICALASYKTISKYIDCSIKWPNDIVADGRKVCGVLIKSTISGDGSAHVLAGIGINVNNTHFDDLSHRAVSLKELTNREFDKNEILKEFFCEFENIYDVMTSEEIIAEYSKACITLGAEICVHYDDKTISGKCIKICDDGTIDIETDGKIMNVNSREVSVRGIYGYV